MERPQHREADRGNKQGQMFQQHREKQDGEGAVMEGRGGW